MSDWDEGLSVYNGHSEVEIVIDRPVAEVWKQFLDLPSWVANFDVKNVHGTPNTEGSITRVNFNEAKEQGLPPQHYHYCKIIKLIPERRYVLKTYSAEGGSYGMQMLGFDDGRFVALEGEGKTKISFAVFCEYKGKVVAEAIAKNPSAWDDDVRQSAEGMLRNLNNLKRMLEGGGRR
jgi:hypothetical protein